MKQKTRVTSKKSLTTANKQADILLTQMRIEQARKDLLKSNKQKGIISNSQQPPPTTTQVAKSKKK